MVRKHLVGILELLGLGMGTMVTRLQQSGMEYLHKDVLRREVNAIVSKAAMYFRRSEDAPSGPSIIVDSLIK